VGGKIGIDLFFGGLWRVDVGNDLHDGHVAIGFVSRLLYGVDAQLGVGVDEEAGEVRNAALAAHRLDQFLGAKIGGVAGVSAQAEEGGRRVLQAARGGDGLAAVVDDFGDRGIGADCVAGENEERIIALGEKAFEQCALLRQLPLLRHAIVTGAQVEVLHGVLAGLFPGGEIRVRTARNEGDLGAGIGQSR